MTTHMRTNKDLSDRPLDMMRTDWGGGAVANDPCYNPNFAIYREKYDNSTK